MSELSSSASRVQEVLQKFGFELEVVELKKSTRTSAEAAEAIGCSVAQIAKSLVFRTIGSNQPVLVIASGQNRVNEQKISEFLGQTIEKADADFVRSATGYAIGGIPPVGHPRGMTTFIDEDLLQYEEIWGAAGTPHAVFKLTPAILQKMVAGKVISVV